MNFHQFGLPANNPMARDSKVLSGMLAILLLASVVSGTIEGDILLTDEQHSLLESTANTNDPFGPQNAVVRRTQSLWRDNTIPYILDGSLSKHFRIKFVLLDA